MASEAKIMQFPVKSPYSPETAADFKAAPLPGAPESVLAAREKAFSRFKKQGLPTPKLERFKYTHIARAVQNRTAESAKPILEIAAPAQFIQNLTDALKAQNWVRDIVQNNPPGVDKYADTALWDLNTAGFTDGVVVDIPADNIVDNPIFITVRGENNTATHPRIIIRLGKNAQATIIETLEGQGTYWRNSVCQMIVDDNAKLSHYRLQNDSTEATYTQSTHITLGRDSYYDGFTLTTGASLSRHQIHADMTGAGGSSAFNGLNLLKGQQLGDTTILVEHQAPHCTSSQFYRTLLAESAKGVFQGKVHVHQIAQKTDGYQLSNTLMLSDKATMETKPELEIYADDVKCSHGATTGRLDDEPLFYLRSRGLSESEARLLLIQAFIEEVIEKIEDEEFREQIRERATTWLQTELSK